MFLKIKETFTHREGKQLLKKEFIASLTTFSALAYALFLIPSLLNQAGIDFGAAMTATLLTAAFASFLMGSLARYPFVLAPGVALAAYFSFSVVQGAGIPWQTALGAVFVCGVLFLLLTVLKVRQAIVLVIPPSLRIAVTSGLGLFLAFIALKNVGMIVAHPTTFVSLGNPLLPPFFMTVIGVVVIVTLTFYRVRGAFFMTIGLLWVIGLFAGWTSFKGFLSWPSSLAPTFLQLDIKNVFRPELVNVILSFLFITLFDTSGTLIGLAEEGGFLRNAKKEFFPRLTPSLLPDACGSILGSLLGTSTVCVYLESAAGISAGGKSGWTAIFTGLFFLIALFFIPFASSIPLFATAPILLFIGGLMLKQMTRLDWEDPSQWIPAFATILFIPLTFSVANGVALGILLYSFIKLFSRRYKEIHPFLWVLCLLFLLKFIFFPV